MGVIIDINEIEISELDKISIIEKATHDKNYSEKDLYELYKRFQFNINQLLNQSLFLFLLIFRWVRFSLFYIFHIPI